MCSFCDRAGSADNRLAGGLGAMICMDRLERCCAERRDPGTVARRTEPVWEEESVAELVATLPLILPSAAQNAAFADEWVGLLRERGVSWTEIDKALGVSRQAAGERFVQRTGRSRGALGERGASRVRNQA